MIRAFVDASVLFAAALSTTGASRELLRESIRGNVELVISDLVIEEAKRNLLLKRPDALPVLEEILAAVDFEITNPTRRGVLRATTYTAAKDAAIVAAAKRAKAMYLASFDRKHLVGVPAVSQGSGLTVLLPDDLLEIVRKRKARQN